MTPMLTETITTPESHARGRHLLEGSLPSGKRRNTLVARSPTEGTHSQLLIAAAPSANGSEPGFAIP